MDAYAVEMLLFVFLLKGATLDVQRKHHTMMKILVNAPLFETALVILTTLLFILDTWCWLTLLSGKLSHNMNFVFKKVYFAITQFHCPLILFLPAAVRMGQLSVVSMNLLLVLDYCRCHVFQLHIINI